MLLRLNSKHRLGCAGDEVQVDEALGNALVCAGVAEVVKRGAVVQDIGGVSFVEDAKPKRAPRRRKKDVDPDGDTDQDTDSDI